MSISTVERKKLYNQVFEMANAMKQRWLDTGMDEEEAYRQFDTMFLLGSAVVEDMEKESRHQTCPPSLKQVQVMLHLFLDIVDRARQKVMMKSSPGTSFEGTMELVSFYVYEEIKIAVNRLGKDESQLEALLDDPALRKQLNLAAASAMKTYDEKGLSGQSAGIEPPHLHLIPGKPEPMDMKPFRNQLEKALNDHLKTLSQYWQRRGMDENLLSNRHKFLGDLVLIALDQIEKDCRVVNLQDRGEIPRIPAKESVVKLILVHFSDAMASAMLEATKLNRPLCDQDKILQNVAFHVFEYSKMAVLSNQEPYTDLTPPIDDAMIAAWLKNIAQQALLCFDGRLQPEQQMEAAQVSLCQVFAQSFAEFKAAADPNQVIVNPWEKAVYYVALALVTATASATSVYWIFHQPDPGQLIVIFLLWLPLGGYLVRKIRNLSSG